MTERQPHRFRSKHRRGAAPPSPTEFELHCAVVDVLRRWTCPDWQWTHLPFGELRSTATAARLARMGVRRGYPDFALFCIDGRVCFLELKRPGGRLSPDQQRIADHMRRAGHRYEVADSLEAATATLKDWGVVCGRFRVQ
jgi:hypothetical protein